ncbi:hypothetical protein PUNSTDRAFT_50389 [Punctularia strigosozonata HHB-11173 SS5]|uniref:uncharacterized protein n=1 Tax=Punctularia strigosozonata (strain HHB-11173) TaxID=741275 RepID=UPI0004417EF8|nr:uncharacterized protein PUNSTDRAFT_50389 [Punctularia strigosozonata HHB-11173 SS5]EIN11372.1 hypothetical protein PUNSTDRAFT_50389 [Punctularia strigosozonata HHB-11173 SS5]
MRAATRLPVLGASRLFRASPVALPFRRAAALPRFRLNSTSSSSSSSSSSSGSKESYPRDLPSDASLGQRLKHLIKAYGWYALGVYIAASTVDFGLTFAAINFLGAEKVSQWAAAAKAYIKSLLPASSSEEEEAHEAADAAAQTEAKKSAGTGKEGLWAMIVLAYTIHKTVLLPFRVGVTAAVTPKFVGWLAKRGWAGSQGTKRAAQHVRDKYGRNRVKKE